MTEGENLDPALNHGSDGLLDVFSGRRRLRESPFHEANGHDTDWNKQTFHSSRGARSVLLEG
jgi:hypothetical protein